MESKSPFDMSQWLEPSALAAMTAGATIRRIPANGTIYTQDEPGREMFRIVSGSVRLSVMQSDGRQLLYQLFEPGDCFGTSSLIDGERRPQTAEAHSDVVLQVFERSFVERLRAAHPSITEGLLKLLSRHLRLLSDYYAGSAFDEVSCRLAQRLVDVAAAFGVEGGGLAMPLSQSELALMVGASRQSVNKALRDFRAAGLVSINGGALTILDMAKLKGVGNKGWRLRCFAA